MRVFIRLLFLTLVLSSAQSVAAPEVRDTLPPTNLDAKPLPGPVWIRDYSPFSAGLYFDFSGGNFFENDEQLSSSVLGFRFSVHTDEEHDWDWNAEIHSADNLLGLQIGRRTFFAPTNDLTPYYKFAVGTHLKGSDGLGNFVEIKRLQVRGSLGFANLFSLTNHLYAEAGLGAAVVGFEYFALVGLNFQL